MSSKCLVFFKIIAKSHNSDHITKNQNQDDQSTSSRIDAEIFTDKGWHLKSLNSKHGN